MALGRRSVTAELVHHSDRGVQDASIEYTQLLIEHGIKISMSRKQIHGVTRRVNRS
jgi:transposase InsO family protein